MAGLQNQYSENASGNTWNGEKVVRITNSAGANLRVEKNIESAVIRHYGEGHTLPVNSFETEHMNGRDWFRVEAYNGHGIGYISASLAEPEYVSKSRSSSDEF